MVSLKLGHHLTLLLMPAACLNFVFLKKRILNLIDFAFKRNDNRAGITEYVTAL